MSGALAAVTALSGVTVTVQDTDSSNIQVAPGLATATLAYFRDGSVTSTGETPDDWAAPSYSTVGDAYEIRATVLSGSVSGTTGSWLALTSTRSWSVSQGSVGTASATLTIEIRLAGGATIDSGTATLTAELA